jgi:hypothetical protein
MSRDVTPAQKRAVLVAMLEAVLLLGNGTKMSQIEHTFGRVHGVRWCEMSSTPVVDFIVASPDQFFIAYAHDQDPLVIRRITTELGGMRRLAVLAEEQAAARKRSGAGKMKKKRVAPGQALLRHTR